MTVIYGHHGNMQHKLLNSVMKPQEKLQQGLCGNHQLPPPLLQLSKTDNFKEPVASIAIG